MLEKIIFALVSLLIICLGFFMRRFPEKFVSMPFVKGGGWKAYWQGHEAAFGREKGISLIQLYGIIMILVGFLLLLLSPFV